MTNHWYHVTVAHIQVGLWFGNVDSIPHEIGPQMCCAFLLDLWYELVQLDIYAYSTMVFYLYRGKSPVHVN